MKRELVVVLFNVPIAGHGIYKICGRLRLVIQMLSQWRELCTCTTMLVVRTCAVAGIEFGVLPILSSLVANLHCSNSSREL